MTAVSPVKSRDEYWMERALELAARAEQAGEVPVGAVIVCQDEVLGEGWNQVVSSHDPSAHAEIMALRSAGRARENYRLPGCQLYVTLEPCAMCLGAVLHARLERLTYAASDPKTGALGGAFQMPGPWAHNHRFEVSGGVLADKASKQLRAFFRARRNRRQDSGTEL